MSSSLLIATEMPTVIEKAAVLDDSNHRYLLTRTWDKTTPAVCFGMLNPSKADHERNDLTILRCIRFAWLWGYGGLVVVNLFAYRTSHPRDLYALDYDLAVGALNDRYIIEAVTSTTLTVVAWGNDGAWHGRDREALDLIRAHTWPMCLGVTKSGMPLHPLARGKYRVPDDVVLQRYVQR